MTRKRSVIAGNGDELKVVGHRGRFTVERTTFGGIFWTTVCSTSNKDIALDCYRKLKGGLK